MSEKKIEKQTRKVADICMTKDEAIEKMRKINVGHRDNIDGRKNALSILAGATPAGGKLFATIFLEDLHIDDSYQRPIQNHIKTLTREWEDIKCDPLKVNYREDGFFYVWDGQHRKEAAQARGIEYLLCDITIGLTVEQEAALFGCQGNGIKKPNPYDIFKAHICAGEEVDTAIKNACDMYDIEVKKSSAPRCLSCLTISREIFRRRHEDHFYWILDLIEKAAWYNFQKGYCHAVVNSLYEIRKVYKDENEFIKRKIVKVIKNISPSDLITKAVARYPQYRDESKSMRMYLVDIINDIDLTDNDFSSGKYVA